MTNIALGQYSHTNIFISACWSKSTNIFLKSSKRLKFTYKKCDSQIKKLLQHSQLFSKDKRGAIKKHYRVANFKVILEICKLDLLITKILVIIFWNFANFLRRSDSPQVKWNLISSAANLVNKLPHVLRKNLRLSISGNKKILEISQIWVEAQPSAESPFCQYQSKNIQK